MGAILRLGIWVLLLFFAGGCAFKSAPGSRFDPQTTPRIAEPFPLSRNQSAVYKPVAWSKLPGWRKDDHAEALSAFVRSCRVMQADARWTSACAEAAQLTPEDAVGARIFFETHFQPYEIIGDGQRSEGLITGYYLPLLKGSRTPGKRFKYPIYQKPADLVLVDLPAYGRGEKPVRGRLTPEGRVVPYYSREQIDSALRPLAGNEIFWVEDPVALFFLHIQGSGYVELENGAVVQVGYAGQNGHSYYPIGRHLIERGAISAEEVSLQTIRGWLEKNPDQMWTVMNKNPSYVFFQEGNITEGAFGSQGVILSPKRSIAVDPGFIPLGTPVFVNAGHPSQAGSLSRLTVAQDTGGAIRGPVRADFFWGQGELAEESAGKMKSQGRLWVLLPKQAGIESEAMP
ncbi:MAG: murein transglycosylase A [Campylobacterales bacterium]